MRPTFQVVSHQLPEHRIVADAIEGRNGWVLLTDNTADHRWSVRLADVVAWRYEVGSGRLTIRTAAWSLVVSGEGHEDPFEVPNELDDLLYRLLFQGSE